MATQNDRKRSHRSLTLALVVLVIGVLALACQTTAASPGGDQQARSRAEGRSETGRKSSAETSGAKGRSAQSGAQGRSEARAQSRGGAG